MDRVHLASMIDQTLLSPVVSDREAVTWLSRQRDRGFASVCVTPRLVLEAVREMQGTDTAVCAVVGFPLGYDTTETKAFEAATLVARGAREIDMVLPIGELIRGEDRSVTEDIAAVVRAVSDGTGGAGLVKVIFETGYLDEGMIRRGCHLAESAGADFVKTSTGFGPRGASIEDVRTMSEAVGGRLGVKAAGGIRTTEQALAFIEAGATRIGTSAGDTLLDGLGKA
jgi:deoxyribose-phosphate aldolase